MARLLRRTASVLVVLVVLVLDLGVVAFATDILYSRTVSCIAIDYPIGGPPGTTSCTSAGRTFEWEWPAATVFLGGMVSIGALVISRWRSSRPAFALAAVIALLAVSWPAELVRESAFNDSGPTQLDLFLGALTSHAGPKPRRAIAHA
jgi:hypothetical protein